MHCCICQQEIVTENPTKYFCQRCWREWNNAILSKQPWVSFCINDEHRLRRQELEDKVLVYGLGEELDISDDGNLVLTKEYFEE
jgi:uncharacterized Zn ribbon protein